ncbi:MAG: hypothetical protein ACE5G5_01085 [Candidatus Methylomirabilales bacterium]
MRVLKQWSGNQAEALTTGMSDLVEHFWKDILFQDRSYTIWSDADRIYLTVHDSGKPIVKVDWSMSEVDTALKALRREILANTQPDPHE